MIMSGALPENKSTTASSETRTGEKLLISARIQQLIKLFSTCRSSKSNEYYGLKGVKKVANSKIVLLCAIWALIGIIVQVSLIRESLTFRRKTLDDKSKEAGANHATARANAVKYGNEVQLERLMEKLERK